MRAGRGNLVRFVGALSLTATFLAGCALFGPEPAAVPEPARRDFFASSSCTGDPKECDKSCLTPHERSEQGEANCRVLAVLFVEENEGVTTYFKGRYGASTFDALAEVPLDNLALLVASACTETKALRPCAAQKKIAAWSESAWKALPPIGNVRWPDGWQKPGNEADKLAVQAQTNEGPKSQFYARRAATDAYERQIGGRPNDESLYALALLQEQQGQLAKAKETYLRLAKEFPTTQYRGHLFFGLGVVLNAEGHAQWREPFKKCVGELPEGHPLAAAARRAGEIPSEWIHPDTVARSEQRQLDEANKVTEAEESKKSDAWDPVGTAVESIAEKRFLSRQAHQLASQTRRPDKTHAGADRIAAHAALLVKERYCPARADFISSYGLSEFAKRAKAMCADRPPNYGGNALTSDCQGVFTSGCPFTPKSPPVASAKVPTGPGKWAKDDEEKDRMRAAEGKDLKAGPHGVVRFACPNGKPVDGAVRTGCICGSDILNPCATGGNFPTQEGDVCIFSCP